MEQAPGNASGISKPARVPTGARSAGEGEGRTGSQAPRPAAAGGARSGGEDGVGGRTGRRLVWTGGERGSRGAGRCVASGLKKITRRGAGPLPLLFCSVLPSLPVSSSWCRASARDFWEAGVRMGKREGGWMEFF